jgi:hypothetical protein
MANETNWPEGFIQTRVKKEDTILMLHYEVHTLLKKEKSKISWNGICADNTLRICNTYCFSMATAVMQTRLNIMFIRTLPVLF